MIKNKIAFVIATALLLTSCATTPPSQGDKMLAASDQAKDLSRKWNEGNDLVSTGTSKQKDGLAMISKGETQVSKGKQLISDGEKMNDDGKEQAMLGARHRQMSKEHFDEKFPESTS